MRRTWYILHSIYTINSNCTHSKCTVITPLDWNDDPKSELFISKHRDVIIINKCIWCQGGWWEFACWFLIHECIYIWHIFHIKFESKIFVIKSQGVFQTRFTWIASRQDSCQVTDYDFDYRPRYNRAWEVVWLLWLICAHLRKTRVTLWDPQKIQSLHWIVHSTVFVLLNYILYGYKWVLISIYYII